MREFGVAEDWVYLDYGLTGANREWPAFARLWLRSGSVTPWSCRGSTGLARSVPDAREIGDSLAACGVRLSLGGQVYNPIDPIGKVVVKILAAFAGLTASPLPCTGLSSSWGGFTLRTPHNVHYAERLALHTFTGLRCIAM